MNGLVSLPNRVQSIFSSYLHGSSAIVIGTSAIFLNSLFEHLSNQGANAAICHNIDEIDGGMAPPDTLVVLEVMGNRQENLHSFVDKLHAKLAHPKILLIGDVEPLAFAEFAPARVAGILSHQASALQVCAALSLINSGMYVIPSTVLGTFDTTPSAEASGEAMSAMFSPREKDVLAGLCRGESNKQIARSLQMAEPTVRAHVRSILVKLGASNRTQASIWAIRHGFGAATGGIRSQTACQPDSSDGN